MRVQDLRNYGKGLLESVPDPEASQRAARVKEAIQRELKSELGAAAETGMRTMVKDEIARMKTHDWAELRKHGLIDNGFIDGVVRRIALMKVMAEIVGMERASAIQCRLLDQTIYDLMSPMWPTIDDYLACGDFFTAFKQYTRASMDANERSGLHEVEWVEDSPVALAFNVTYCVWHEVAKALGDPYLCYPSTCYGDEVTIPLVLEPVGYRFRRSSTLAQGAPACDFRYELAR